MGPRTLLILVGASFALTFYLLGYAEVKYTAHAHWINHWGYCGVSGPIYINKDFHCPNGRQPLSDLTATEIGMMNDYPVLRISPITMPYGLPLVAAALVAYSYFSRGGNKIKRIKFP